MIAFAAKGGPLIVLSNMNRASLRNEWRKDQSPEWWPPNLKRISCAWKSIENVVMWLWCISSCIQAKQNRHINNADALIQTHMRMRNSGRMFQTGKFES